MSYAEHSRSSARHFAAPSAASLPTASLTDRLPTDVSDFQPFAVDGHAPVVEIARERFPALDAVIQSVRNIGALGYELALRNQPFVQRVANRLGP